MLLLLLFPFLLIKHSQANCPKGCNETISLYEDIHCKPVYDNSNDCCPVEYDCSHILNKPKTECILQGKFYKIGESVPEEESYGSCQIGCRCIGGYTPSFSCAILDCAEHLGLRPPGNCTNTYKLDACCSVGKICPPFDDLAKCEVDGNTYYEGQRFESPSDRCLSCVCQKGFKGEFVEPFCKNTGCLTELHSSARILNNCAPVYISGDNCCPFTFICPEDHAFTIKKAKAETGKPTCKFGQEVLNIGDNFVKAETYAGYHTIETKCECRIPPLVTCIQKDIFDLEKTPEHIKQSLNL